jgi:adenine-specific DNA-methyltransferase
MSKNQKLELTWIGKENRPKLEPRILIEDPAKSHHAPFRVSDKDIFDNRLIFGDNLLALKALEHEFAGKIKCACIDPPYNTGAAWEQYDDGVEHSLWLNLMRDRLEILAGLLKPEGSIWICLDDNEAHYLKVLCDEVFGRPNFLACLAWQHSVQGKGYSGKFSVNHNYVLAYRRSEAFVLGDLPRKEEHNVNYSNPDNDPNGPWRAGDVRNALYRPNLIYELITPSGKAIKPPPKGWRWSKETMAEKIAIGQIMFRDNETRIIHKIYLKGQEGRVPETLWFGEDVGTTREASSESKTLFGVEKAFATPKPERMIQRILEIATNPGDLVLDSFAGSGTTGAVAHKMGRRWIMVELGEHCHTHIIPRLKKVIDGEDKGGVTEAAGWKGGGGFRYYHLAPSLLQKDEFGNWVISKEYNPAMLAEAMCKLEGFTYAPSDTAYWQHGHSTETDFIYVTTQTLTREQLQKLSDEVGESRSLLVMCGAFRVKNLGEFPNLTVKKIPKAVLNRCEWDHDDYSLEIKNLPMKAPEEDIASEAPATGKKPRSKEERRASVQQPSLFDLTGQENKP